MCAQTERDLEAPRRFQQFFCGTGERSLNCLAAGFEKKRKNSQTMRNVFVCWLIGEVEKVFYKFGNWSRRDWKRKKEMFSIIITMAWALGAKESQVKEGNVWAEIWYWSLNFVRLQTMKICSNLKCYKIYFFFWQFAIKICHNFFFLTIFSSLWYIFCTSRFVNCFNFHQLVSKSIFSRVHYRISEQQLL